MAICAIKTEKDICERHKCAHPGHTFALAIDPSDKGELWRKIQDNRVNPPTTGIAMPCSSCGGKPDPVMARKPTDLEPKGWLATVTHYVGSTLKHAAGGGKEVPAEVRAERRSECVRCEHRDPVHDSCKICHCPLHKTILGDKLARPKEYCQAGKWGTWPAGKGKIAMSSVLGTIRPYILAIPKRQGELNETLERWDRTDWPGDPIVVMQHPDMPIGTQNERWAATAQNSYNLIKHMWEDGVDWGLFTEDDIEPNKHLYWNLVNWAPLVRKDIQIASLYMPHTVELPFFPTSEQRPGEHRTARVNTVENWRIPKPMTGKFPRFNLWGSQCYVMSRFFIQKCMEMWWDVPGGQDGRVNRIAMRLQQPIYYHLPDLVEHHHPETGSNFNSPWHKSMDFDANWKSPKLMLTTAS
jgi:hypothetical protein